MQQRNRCFIFLAFFIVEDEDFEPAIDDKPIKSADRWDGEDADDDGIKVNIFQLFRYLHQRKAKLFRFLVGFFFSL